VIPLRKSSIRVYTRGGFKLESPLRPLGRLVRGPAVRRPLTLLGLVDLHRAQTAKVQTRELVDEAFNRVGHLYYTFIFFCIVLVMTPRLLYSIVFEFSILLALETLYLDPNKLGSFRKCLAYSSCKL